MKKNLFYLAALLIGAVSLTACSSSDDDGSGKSGSLSKPVNADNARRIVLTDNASGLREVDFGSGSDAVLTLTGPLTAPAAFPAAPAAPSVLDYLIAKYAKAGNTYTIEGFGTVTIVSENGNSLVVEVKRDGGTAEQVEATQQAVAVTDSKAIDFCRSWEVVTTAFTYTEYDAAGNSKRPVGGNFKGCNLTEIGQWLKNTHGVDIMAELAAKEAVERVVVTTGGTYALKFKNTESVGTWRWTDATAGKLRYTWNDPAGMSNNFEAGTATFTTEKGYGVLQMAGSLQETAGGTRYTVELTFRLQQAS
ncbi:MAG: hypothetical protein IJ722_00420 [Alloprevotella sp.]|nr:hypothetical protein [Alloprevotella sp.]